MRIKLFLVVKEHLGHYAAFTDECMAKRDNDQHEGPGVASLDTSGLDWVGLKPPGSGAAEGCIGIIEMEKD